MRQLNKNYIEIPISLAHYILKMMWAFAYILNDYDISRLRHTSSHKN